MTNYRHDAPIRAVIFDFGGVLIDWNPRHLYRKLFSEEAEMEAFLAEVGFFDWNIQLDRGLPYVEGVAQLSERFPARADYISAFFHRWKESIAGPMAALQVARELKDAGYPLYGLSNWSAETFHHVEREYDFFQWFDEIVLSGRVGACKPEPTIYQHLLDRIPFSAGECVFIDDVPHNVQGAEAMGIKGIHFQCVDQLREDLVRLGLPIAATAAAPSSP